MTRRYVKDWTNAVPFFLENVALRKTGKGEGWAFCSVECIGDAGDSIVGVCQHRPLKSGPNKGRRKFFGDVVKCVVTRDELEAESLRYEQDTGKCHHCGGVGIKAVGHSIHEGTLVEDCRQCNGTGKAKEVRRV